MAKLPQDFTDFIALEAFGAPLRAHGVAPAHFAREGDADRFGIAPLKVEVLTTISGVSFDDALQLPPSMRKAGRRHVPVPKCESFG